MHHVAIMNKKWGLINKILSGEKTIESRWYLTKRSPWDRIDPGDTVYFKDSGEPITAKATVSRIIQYEGLSPEKARAILEKHGRDIWPYGLDDFYEMVKEKKYAVLIFLTHPQKISRFDIEKTGFGNAAAWLSLKDIDQIKKTS